MTEIKLSAGEIVQAAIVGVMRRIQNIRDGNNHKYGASQATAWQMDIEGALGELALAKHLNIFWSKGKPRDSDVGEFQVRTTAKHNNRLILHKDDDDDARYYLITGLNGCYRVQGWIHGRDGKQERYWEDPVGGRPCYFVPQDVLHEALP